MSTYDELRKELDDTKHVNNTTERERIIAKVTATAVVDIAESLHTLLEAFTSEYVTADPDENVDGGPERTGGEEPDPNVNARPLEVGDTVTAEGGDELATVIELSESEGDVAAVIEWEHGGTAKVWANMLTRYAPTADPFDDPADVNGADYLADIEAEQGAADAFSALKGKRADRG